MIFSKKWKKKDTINRVFITLIKKRQWKNSNTTYTDKSTRNIDSYLISNNFKVKYSNKNNNLITGIDISEGNSKSSASWGYDEINKNQLGIFALDTYKFTDNLNSNVGFRN